MNRYRFELHALIHSNIMGGTNFQNLALDINGKNTDEAG
jgi:hypothetical protein